MGFLAAIPVIGQALDSLFGGVDKISTTDEERLKYKQLIMATYIPILGAIVEADKELQALRLKIEEVAIKSGHWYVWSLRPTLCYLTFWNWMFTKLGVLSGDPTEAFYAFGLVFGIFGTSRGIEKITNIFKGKERI